MGWVEHDYRDPDALARALAQTLHLACRDAIAARGRAVLALAGGRTPFPAYRALASMPLHLRRSGQVTSCLSTRVG